MEAIISGGGGSSSESTVISKEQQEEESTTEIPYEVSDESELELGLGLTLAINNSNNNKNQNNKQIPRFLTAKDLKKNSSSSSNSNININGGSPSSASSCSSLGLRPPSSLKPCSNNNNNNNNNINSNVVSAGTKRAASPTAASQVVGWPPIRAYRMNSMANQAKSVANGENDSEFDEMKEKDKIYGGDEKGNANGKERAPSKNSLFVKVNMDGVAIGRKVDLNAHSSYESLARALEEMFSNRAAEKSNGEELMLMPKTTRPSRLLDGSSDFVLTYEDKDGDWMLVGDVPWGMFTTSVKRLKIMRTSEANGLAPRSEERSAKQRSRPI